MENLRKIPPETLKNALKELCNKTGLTDDDFEDKFSNDVKDCLEYLEEWYRPEQIIQYVAEKARAGLRPKRRRRSKRKGSKKKRSKKSKRRSRKY